MENDIMITPGNVGEVVQGLRLEQRLAQTKLSVLAGMSSNSVLRLETGATRLLFDNIYNILDVLGYDVVARKRQPAAGTEDTGDQSTAKAKHIKEAAKQRELIEQAKAKSKQWAAERKKEKANTNNN